MLFMVESNSEESVKVDAPNWMMAMTKAMAFMDIDPASMGRWICTPDASGTVHIEDPVAGGSWFVRPEGESAGVQVVASGASAAAPPVEAPAAKEPAAPTPSAPPPMLQMPTRPSIKAPEPEPEPEPEEVAPSEPGAIAPPTPAAITPPQPAAAAAPEPAPEPIAEGAAPSDLAERLFDLSFDITGESPNVACSKSLDLILEFVPCDAASVLRGTLNDVALTFVAVHGPVADSLLGRKVAFGDGLVGLCFDMGFPIQVRDVEHDERHLADIDEETGFTTREVLCVPVKNEHGTFGVIQLINPPASFEHWHVDAADTVSRTLASALSGV